MQKLLGHSAITTTMIYAHLAKGYLTNSVTSLKYRCRVVTQASLVTASAGKGLTRECVLFESLLVLNEPEWWNWQTQGT